jgi:hypothetical protein
MAKGHAHGARPLHENLQTHGTRTMTRPSMLGPWMEQWYKYVPAFGKVRSAVAPLLSGGGGVMSPPGGAAPSQITLCAIPGNDHVTVPPVAIFAVSGSNVCTVALAVTILLVGSALTLTVVAGAVLVTPPAVRDAVTVEVPCASAVTSPVVETDAAVPLAVKVAPGRLIGAPF